jgi:hypothetical protein
MYPRQAICIGDKAKIYTPLKEHGGKSCNNLLPFTPQEDSWYSFLLEDESTQGS